MRLPTLSDPIEVGAEIIADGAGVRGTITTPSTTQSFVIPTDLIPQVCEMWMQRYRGAVAMRAALAPPEPAVLPAQMRAPASAETPANGAAAASSSSTSAAE